MCLPSSSLYRKQSRRCDEKLLPPLLSPLSDDPPRKRTSDSSSSLCQEGGTTGLMPCFTSSTSSHKHRRGEGKAAAHARNAGVSPQQSYVTYLKLLRVSLEISNCIKYEDEQLKHWSCSHLTFSRCVESYIVLITLFSIIILKKFKKTFKCC